MNDYIRRSAMDRPFDPGHPHVARARILGPGDWRYHLERSNRIEGDVWDVCELSDEGRQANAREGVGAVLLSLLFFWG